MALPSCRNPVPPPCCVQGLHGRFGHALLPTLLFFPIEGRLKKATKRTSSQPRLVAATSLLPTSCGRCAASHHDCPVSPFGLLTASSSPSHCCWRHQLLTIEQGATPRSSRRPAVGRRRRVSIGYTLVILFHHVARFKYIIILLFN